MGRAKTILQSEFPYHISSRCINREWFKIPMEVVWDIFCEELYLTTKMYNLKNHAFVLMSNHYHLIVSTPEANISQAMHRLQGNVSRRLNEKGNRINETFAGRYFKTVLSHSNFYLNTYKYIYQNPIRANICKRTEAYPYSTLSGLLGFNKLLVPLEFDYTLFDSLEESLVWLNERPSAKALESVRYGLKRANFKHKKCPKKNRPLMGNDDLL